MLLGITFIAVVQILGTMMGLDFQHRTLLICMFTYALLGSLVLTGIVAMPITRYIADMLYEKRHDLILPSFEGSLAVLLPICFVLSLTFQLATGQSLTLVIFNVILFCELIVVWMTTNYLTAIRDFKSILVGYLLTIATSVLASMLLCAYFEPALEIFMGAIVLGYGVMVIISILLLYRYFPHAHEHYLLWLHWLSMHRSLIIVGVGSYVGLFSYIVISWLGPQGTEVAYLYYACPARDTAAFFAYLSVLVTQVTFVVSTEVNFYPAYRKYFELLNTDGSLAEIDAQQANMLSILERELGDVAFKQLLTTALMISLGAAILEALPLGFTPSMQTTFILLCVGYCAYAIANVLTLMCLYFSENRGAAIAVGAFALATTALSVLSLYLPPQNYMAGFVVGSLIFLFVAWLMLYRYTNDLPYRVLAGQPLLSRERKGFLDKLALKH